jgi:hypothetical protein
MNKKIIAGVVLPLAVLPLLVFAKNTARSQYVLERDQVREGNLYAVSENVLISGTAMADLTAVGGEIVVAGDIGEDVLLVGGKSQLAGKVSGDVRLVGGETVVSGSIGGDLAGAAGKIYTSTGSVIGGDVILFGGEVVLQSAVRGNVRVSGGEVTLNGLVQGDVEVNGGKLIVGDQAVLQGSLTYRGPRAPIISSSAQIQGKVEYVRDDFGHRDLRFFARKVWLFGSVASVLMSIILALVLLKVFKRQTPEFIYTSLNRFWPSMGFGVVGFLVIGILSLFLMVSVVGLPLGIIGLLLLVLGNIVAAGLSGIIFGTWLNKVIRRRQHYQVTVGTAVWGSLLLCVVALVPVIGALVCLVFHLIGLGALIQAAHRWFKVVSHA